ncbi:cryptochrome, DASH family [Synechococcus sp. PCC 7335]|uniref:DASH family cryptochrome n=1 Tax=Synechococcus sp. (strain ATCC 29403 / PCC 7335) TaxID=91464 RepID=UPI00017ED644|nr:DASH family cryptochrome [Synechococcus sp. PCC 7335]EDX86882.1 cryptochrome, DASH family [Synechococcus sp. PCC 7335]
MRILLWLRNDLRLHDHEPLHRATEQGADIIPVYCFDPRQFQATSFGFPKTGSYRAQFLIETVAALKAELRSRGSNLVILQGKPEEEIPALVKAFDIAAVYWHEEVTPEEIEVEQRLETVLNQLKVTSEVYWGATLYHPDDLPFEVSQLPEVFTQFRKAIEKNTQVFPTFPTPEKLPSLPNEIEPGELPSLSDLGLERTPIDEKGVLPFKGGESKGLDRLQHYFWNADRLQRYKETRNGMLGADYSSKFSPWLANGSLSPRRVYEEVQRYERERKKNNSTYWMIFELMWRDYFRFVCVKYGRKIFRKGGIRGLPIEWQQDWKRFDLWREGKTGYPLIDANMRELAATGFMSNRGRQNVASFLTKNLGIDWRMGAEWFESLLIDYDVCSNWGNWNYTAGVGNDARGFRYFNIPKQSKDYDSEGKYVKHWLPELKTLPAKKVHTPWTLQTVEQKQFNVRLGVDYPNPVVDLQKSVSVNERRYEDAWQQKKHRR